MKNFHPASAAFLVAACFSVLSAHSARAQSTTPGGVTGGGNGAADTNASPDEPLIVAPDRPSFTNGTLVVPTGHIQIEGGATLTRSGGDRSAAFGELLVRLPLQQNLELRVGVPSYLRQRGGGASSKGFDDSNLGVKLRLSKGARHRPATGLLFSTTLPTGSRRVAQHRYQPQATFLLDYSLSEALSLSANAGFARPTDDGQRFDQAFASITAGYTLSPRVGAYVETYAFNHADASGKSARYADTGLSYLVNPKLMLDARVGFGLNNHVGGPDYSYGAGASRLF